ncbi:MAG: HAD family hydrolase [Cyanobacteria bacterium P01_A01_bin.123]
MTHNVQSTSPRNKVTVGISRRLPLTPGSTIFCDFDGPLVDVSDRYYSTYQQALTALATDHIAQGLRIHLRRLSKVEFWRMKQNRMGDRMIAQWSGLEGQQIDAFLDRVQQIVNQPSLLHQDCLQPHVKQAIQGLKVQGVRIVLVTLRQQDQVLEILRAHHLDHAISCVYGATERDAAYCNHADHKTALLQTAISAQQSDGFITHNAWMIGDTEADILAGQSLGIPTLALTCGIRSETYLKRYGPTAICHDLRSAVDFLLPICQLTLQFA